MVFLFSFACGALFRVLMAAPPAPSSTPCDDWMHSVQWYDAKVDAVLDGQEVEHLLTLLQRAQELGPEGEAGSLPQLARLVESRISRLGDIDPPVELAALHQQLVDFHRAVLDAALRPPASGGKAPVPRNRECYRTLLTYFEQLHDDLVAHGCTGGDTVALQERVIPQLRAIVGSWSDNGD